MQFSEDQINRYARHILLQEIGGEGQKKLLDAKVLVIGAGGLGSPNILYLAAAGVGTIGVVDDDRVDLSNLQRQILHGTDDIGRSKVSSAAESVAKIIITEFETPWVKVSVGKPGAVRGSQDVGIIIERTEKDYPDSLID